MCGIVGSFSLANIELGFEHIKQRGTKGYSLSVVDIEGILLQKKAYSLPETTIESAIQDAKLAYPSDGNNARYYILHVQSPTGAVSAPHPAIAGNEKGWQYLWHNGMLNSNAFRGSATAQWDTQMLLIDLMSRGTKALDEFEGSFACIMLDVEKGLTCFRNAIAPLFYSPGGTLSSSDKFVGSVKLDTNKIYTLTRDYDCFDLKVTGSFENSHNPYGV